jgi:hypothetical protein
LGELSTQVGTWLLENKLAFLLAVAALSASARALLRRQDRANLETLQQVERAAHGISESEMALAVKLLQTLHLSVSERQELPDGRMRFSALVCAARVELASGFFIPSHLRPSDEFSGALLEQRDDTYWVHKRFEVGVGRYGPTSSVPAPDLRTALRQYIAAYGGQGQIDDVSIELDA